MSTDPLQGRKNHQTPMSWHQTVELVKAQVKAQWAGDGVRLASLLGLRGRGQRYYCPGCQPLGGKTPDLAIYEWNYRCYKCGAHGDLIGLVQWARPCDFRTALDFLAGPSGGLEPTHPVRRRSTPSRSQHPPLTGSDSLTPQDQTTLRSVVLQAFLDACLPPIGAALTALTRRGIAPEVLTRAHLRLWPAASQAKAEQVMSDLIHQFRSEALQSAGLLTNQDRPTFGPYWSAGAPFLIFPYYDQGRPLALKARALISGQLARKLKLPRFLNTTGPIPCFYNADILTSQGPGLPDQDHVLICEGETDTLTAWSCGLTAVGIPGWAGFKASWAASLRGRRVFLVLDHDAAGERGTRDVQEKLQSAGVQSISQIQLPPGMDLNDYVRAPDPDDLRPILTRWQSHGLRLQTATEANPDAPSHALRIVHPHARLAATTGRVLWHLSGEHSADFPVWPDDPRLDNLFPHQVQWMFLRAQYRQLPLRILLHSLTQAGLWATTTHPQSDHWYQTLADDANTWIDGDEEPEPSAPLNHPYAHDWQALYQAVIQYRTRWAPTEDNPISTHDHHNVTAPQNLIVTTLSGRPLVVPLPTLEDATQRGRLALRQFIRGSVADIVHRALVWLERDGSQNHHLAEVGFLWFDQIWMASPVDDPSLLAWLKERMRASATIHQIDCPVHVAVHPAHTHQ